MSDPIWLDKGVYQGVTSWRFGNYLMEMEIQLNDRFATSSLQKLMLSTAFL